jgi:hypothetical protein
VRNTAQTSNLRGCCRDFGAGGASHKLELNMSRLTASFISSAAQSQKAGERPLDPTVLFAGIGLLALAVAFVFGQPGVWF